MSEQKNTGDQIHATISGDVSGQVAVGKNISQKQTSINTVSPVTEADLAALRQEFAKLRTQIEAEVPPEKQAPALERVQEMEEAITAEKPDLDTLSGVKAWFGKHLPAMAGAVTSVVVNPIVGQLVSAAGETLADEFRHRFGHQ